MDTTLRTFKDFMEIYNKIAEACFTHCVNTLGDREMTTEEKTCVDLCTLKHIHVNQTVMKLYSQIQPEFINAKLEQMKLQEEQMKVQEQQMKVQEEQLTTVVN